jgi:nicotinamide mononucleotide (NMN) deamidase PncC
MEMEWKDFNIDLLNRKTIDNYKNNAQKTAYYLIDTCIKINTNTSILHKITTAESLTAGLIMATLVDIPIGGLHKYGCFGVYDTDAKRVFLGVKVKDVYTHLCASQMSIGVLQNSNASIAIAVNAI